MSIALEKTPLYQWHVAQQARIVDFGGWLMPVQYESIVTEHRATREGVTLFDVSHMGRFRFDGAGAAQFLDGLLTRRVVGLSEGRIRYSLITNAEGGVLDDVLVYRLVDPTGRPYHSLVVNAGNRTKIADFIRRHLPESDDVQFADQTKKTAMIAVQGPQALGIAAPLLDFDPTSLRYFTGRWGRCGDTEALVSRTGYTGEDGLELVVAAEAAESVWQSLIDGGQNVGVIAAGLGARDTLRLEAAMPLYGHELSEQINPFQAGLGFAVNLKDRQFVGRDALEQLGRAPQTTARVGLEMDCQRVPREHFPVLSEGQRVGEVTSGTFSPTLQRPIAMAYVNVAHAELGTQLQVDIRGRPEPARVVQLPFYQRC